MTQRTAIVHLRLMAGGAEDDFNGEVEMARVPVVGDEIDHDDGTYLVRHVTLYTDGSVPYVVAR